MSRKIIDRRLLVILLIVFVQMVGAAMVLPILPLFAQREFDISPPVIALLISVFFAGQFVGGPWLGRLSDRYGRMPVLILSQLGTAISFAMLGVANSVWLLFVARILDGVTGGNIIVAQAYITDITPKQQRTTALGYTFAVFGLGFIIGPALGGVLSALLGPRIPFLIAAGAAVIAMVLTRLVLEETVTEEHRQNSRTQSSSLSLSSILANTPLTTVLVIAFVGQFALGLLQGTFALYSEAVLFKGESEETVNLGVGLLLGAVGVGQLFTQTILLKRLLARFGDLWLVFTGTLVRALGLLIFAVVTTPLLGAVGSLFFAVGLGLAMPPLQSLTTQTTPDAQRGGALGVFQAVVSLATIVATAIAGAIFALNPTLPYWIGALLSLLALAPALLLPAQLRQQRLALGHGFSATD